MALTASGDRTLANDSRHPRASIERMFVELGGIQWESRIASAGGGSPVHGDPEKATGKATARRPGRGACKAAAMILKEVDMLSLAVDPEPVPLARDEHGAWRIGGTRVTLETLVAAFDRGDTPEEIHEQYPAVALGDVYAVLTYYVRHRGLVQTYLDERESVGAEVQARAEREFTPDGLRQRLVGRLDR